jgi:entericidin B
MAREARISVIQYQGAALARFELNLHDRRFEMIRKILASLVATLFFAGAFGTLAGCNTVEGAGTDIQQGGKALKDEAREHKNY